MGGRRRFGHAPGPAPLSLRDWTLKARSRRARKGGPPNPESHRDQRPASGLLTTDRTQWPGGSGQAGGLLVAGWSLPRRGTRGTPRSPDGPPGGAAPGTAEQAAAGRGMAMTGWLPAHIVRKG
ncbi:hypothetical protein Asera_61410 [Actinocatenispora sera]|uniref:Uncharacterized protein n=1 Tax=Actinocatenispora sera TaxID=390989 RepID=A0A810L9S8_9ACTN|nr:hypothetical protein Asera_61410 [Actinocatenispora sera]